MNKTLYLIFICLLLCAGTHLVAQTFDYNRVSGHPRLLMKQGEEQQIRESLKDNPEMQRVYKQIVGEADRLLVCPTLTYKKEGRRLLAVSREALKRIFDLSFVYRMTGEDKYRLRAEQENFLDLSFDNISAYGANAAMMHYSAKEETAAELKPEGFLLVDSGGHYYEGTTDITRTIAMGSVTKLQKQHYTAVLMGNLRLMDAKFRYGLSGAHLDYLAREPLYRMGLDFKHGTGHGVGYLLNVHEGPNAIRSRVAEDGVFKQGMITSDEPGLYIEGAYGIRLENLILCVHAEKTEYGQFMQFEPLTFVPFDPEAVDLEMLTGRDKELFEGYQKQVYETLAPYLTEEEKQWLLRETRNL